MEQEKESLKNESGENKPVVTTDQNYIEAIKEMKENTVEKGLYDAALEENKKLLKMVMDGTKPEDKEQSKKELTEKITNLRKELFVEDSNLNDLQFVTKSLELRDAILERDGEDIFLPKGKNIVPTEADIEGAQRSAKVFRECVDYANGNNAIFINELQRRTIEVNPMAKLRR